MIKIGEKELICDLAETYQIYNYRKLPPATVAVFCIGLRDDSRIKMKLSGSKVSPNILLLSGIIDRLNLLLWTKTKDAEKGLNKPKPILEHLYEKESEVSSFTSGKEFEEERQRIIEGR
ncbi:MAG TPA: DUF5361 domain-containing protein [Syntrophomonadaceae bacterium]|nr:DUF5361 domain-containing protein [Syntrophomonadaceae bacterium]